jgi:hypothetical protein
MRESLEDGTGKDDMIMLRWLAAEGRLAVSESFMIGGNTKVPHGPLIASPRLF